MLKDNALPPPNKKSAAFLQSITPMGYAAFSPCGGLASSLATPTVAVERGQVSVYLPETANRKEHKITKLAGCDVAGPVGSGSLWLEMRFLFAIAWIIRCHNYTKSSSVDRR
jgi:hypothetical protein